MNTTLCFECSKPADIQHHVVPASKGGNKTIPLCSACHSLVHDAKLMSTSELIKNGRKRSREVREEVLKMYRSGLAKRHIAKCLNISRTTVYNILGNCGLYTNEGRGLFEKVDEATIEQIKTLRKENKTWQEIETELELSHVHIFRIARQESMDKGGYGGNSKKRSSYITVTPEVVEQATKLHSEGESWTTIANRIGIDRVTLYRHGLPQQLGRNKAKYTYKRLTAEMKDQATIMRKEGKTWNEIATALGVSQSTLRNHGIK